MVCCNFFSSQRIDDIGVKAVRLQKILLFLWIIQAITVIFSGEGWLSLMIYGLVLWIGFVGARHRRTGFLRTFYLIHVIFAILAIISFAIIAGVFFNWKNNVCDDAPTPGAKLYVTWTAEQEGYEGSNIDEVSSLSPQVTSSAAYEVASYISDPVQSAVLYIEGSYAVLVENPNQQAKRHDDEDEDINEENEDEDEDESDYEASYCWEPEEGVDNCSGQKSLLLGQCDDGTLNMHEAFKQLHESKQQFAEVSSSEIPVAQKSSQSTSWVFIPMILASVIVGLLKIYALLLAFKIRKMLLNQRRNQNIEEQGVQMDEQPPVFFAPPQAGKDGYVQLQQIPPQVFVTPDGSVQYASFYPQVPVQQQPDTSRDEEIARSLQNQE